MEDTKHKVFISYYHDDDQEHRDRFEALFGHLFINKSVSLGEISDDLSTDYINKLIQEEYITDTSVLVVLVGKNTWKRKHVDWEIYAALSKKVGGYSGLLGLCLPDNPNYGKDKYNSDTIPPRLVDNLKSGYAKLFDWTTSEHNIKAYIEDAFVARRRRMDNVENVRIRYKNDR